MRGKGSLTTLKPTLLGITPAYAGKSMRYACAGASGQDHPRLCGEKVRLLRLSQHILGITPAYAGKSFLSTSRAFCI